jgi:hypothetical protein
MKFLLWLLSLSEQKIKLSESSAGSSEAGERLVVKNEIATPFGLAMTTCTPKILDAFLLDITGRVGMRPGGCR